jgi:hypothetical protein
LFQQAPGHMAVLRGPDHVYALVNAAYQRLVGDRDLIGKPVREALPELAGQGFFELLDEVYMTGKPFVGHQMPAKVERQPDGPVEEIFVDFSLPADHRGRRTGLRYLCRRQRCHRARPSRGLPAAAAQ